MSLEDDPLVLRENPFLVLDQVLDVVDGAVGPHVEGDCFSCQGLDLDVHAEGFALVLELIKLLLKGSCFLFYGLWLMFYGLCFIVFFESWISSVVSSSSLLSAPAISACRSWQVYSVFVFIVFIAAP